MRRNIFLPAINLLFLAPLVLGASSDAGSTASPAIFAGDATWNFGEVAEGFVAHGEIAIENRGGAPLTILNIRATCSGCSAASTIEAPIPPGGNSAVRIQFNTAGYSGRQERIIYLHSNDPKAPFIQIKVVGTVKRDPERPVIALSEDSWDADLIAAGQTVEKTFRVRNDGMRELEIKGVYALEPLQVSCNKKTLASGEEAEIKVKIAPKDFRGVINDQVVVNTSDPVSPSKTIQVTGYVAKAAAVAAAPDGAIIIRPRDPAKLPGTDRVFYREYEIINNASSVVVLRCLSAEANTRLDADNITLSPGGSRVVKAVPGAKAPEEDRLSIEASIVAYPLRQAAPEK